jgi:hypothetical protein
LAIVAERTRNTSNHLLEYRAMGIAPGAPMTPDVNWIQIQSHRGFRFERSRGSPVRYTRKVDRAGAIP